MVSCEISIMTFLLNHVRGLEGNPFYYVREMFISRLEQVSKFKESKFFIMFFALRETLPLSPKVVSYTNMMSRNKNMSRTRQSVPLLIWCAIWDPWRIISQDSAVGMSSEEFTMCPIMKHCIFIIGASLQPYLQSMTLSILLDSPTSSTTSTKPIKKSVTETRERMVENVHEKRISWHYPTYSPDLLGLSHGSLSWTIFSCQYWSTEYHVELSLLNPDWSLCLKITPKFMEFPVSIQEKTNYTEQIKRLWGKKSLLYT